MGGSRTKDGLVGASPYPLFVGMLSGSPLLTAELGPGCKPLCPTVLQYCIQQPMLGNKAVSQ
jgi:hypothetical protein